MDKNERLERLVEYYGNGNKSHFAKILGVKAQTINTWLSRNTYDTELIFAKCDNINASWLLSGEGNMLRSESEMVEKLPSVNQTYEGTPYFNVDFIGGFDVIVNDQTRNPDFYINYPPYNQEGVVWCNLTGHSMEPEISNGDIIALREVTTPIQYLPAGEIYGIVTEEYRTVKRVRLSQKEGFVRLIPSNKSEEFCEQEIPISMILKVYAVLGSIRKFF
ncbi:MAG TPA: helix-turn-helix domain-containing protein [Candidatus Onthomorpha intestinigallinarum]|uniref:Helix-turn-helix domain-containing protein n=1 Tax=Candidatus Onthomorpha intestinigallinarum TaxID=2840880 RepID=A0A9D1UH98_9BACT|nr:helix-turn-helix domain-containing protein [Candidatus Onthomorpha intestinigallinarum]